MAPTHIRHLKPIADRGYYSGPETKGYEDHGIAGYVSKPMTSNSKSEGRFSKDEPAGGDPVDGSRPR